jgi:hypothetical protein
MRTTVELPDELFRQAKARAALQGRALKAIVADGLRLVLRAPADLGVSSNRTRFPIIKTKEPRRRVTAEMVASAEEKLLSQEADTHGRVDRH